MTCLEWSMQSWVLGFFGGGSLDGYRTVGEFRMTLVPAPGAPLLAAIAFVGGTRRRR